MHPTKSPPASWHGGAWLHVGPRVVARLEAPGGFRAVSVPHHRSVFSYVRGSGAGGTRGLPAEPVLPARPRGRLAGMLTWYAAQQDASRFASFEAELVMSCGFARREARRSRLATGARGFALRRGSLRDPKARPALPEHIPTAFIPKSTRRRSPAGCPGSNLALLGTSRALARRGRAPAPGGDPALCRWVSAQAGGAGGCRGFFMDPCNRARAHTCPAHATALKFRGERGGTAPALGHPQEGLGSAGVTEHPLCFRSGLLAGWETWRAGRGRNPAGKARLAVRHAKQLGGESSGFSC